MNRRWFAYNHKAQLMLREQRRDEPDTLNIGRFFDSWQEAHEYLRNKAAERVRKADAESVAAYAVRAKILAMKEP